MPVHHKHAGAHALSQTQRLALTLLRDHGIGVVTSGMTALLDGQPWINWQTAYSLQDRRLCRVRGVGDEAEVTLSEEG